MKLSETTHIQHAAIPTDSSHFLCCTIDNRRSMNQEDDASYYCLSLMIAVCNPNCLYERRNRLLESGIKSAPPHMDLLPEMFPVPHCECMTALSSSGLSSCLFTGITSIESSNTRSDANDHMNTWKNHRWFQHCKMWVLQGSCKSVKSMKSLAHNVASARLVLLCLTTDYGELILRLHIELVCCIKCLWLLWMCFASHLNRLHGLRRMAMHATKFKTQRNPG